MSQEQPKTWAEMFAEGLREVGVLTLVFGLLDKFVLGRAPTPWIIGVVGTAFASFMFGGIIERRRRRDG